MYNEYLRMNKKLYISLGIMAVVIMGAAFLSQNKMSYDANSEYSSSDTSGLPEAKPMEVVELKNGDTYNLTAGFVQKKLGNRNYRMLAYNGSIPGPLIKVAQGAEATINFKNNTDMKTLLHSHGVRMDNAFDGSQTTQEEMEPGETFVYKLKFSDAGMYWYHPHVREDFQQELGLYGNYLVTPSEPGYWNPVNQEVPLFLDDILIENGQIRLNKIEAGHTLMGRFGNMMLVNGELDYRLDVKRGEVIRFYVTNAANTRPFNFTIAGAKMKLVGGDGGAVEREEWKDAVIIGPSERSVAEVLFDMEGSFMMQNKTPNKIYALGTVLVSGDAASPSYAETFATLRTNAAAVKSIDPYRRYFDRPIDKHLALTINMMDGMMSSSGGHMMSDGTMMGGMDMGEVPEGGIEWDDDMQMMNEMSNKQMTNWKIVDEGTSKTNMDIDWKFKVGEIVKIRITNDVKSAHPMQHPIHFHGQQFLALDRNGVPQTNLVWKDTVLVPAGQYVDILLNASNLGNWMAHCHIAEHLEAGMMFSFKVVI